MTAFSSLIATARGALWLSTDGEIERLSAPQAAMRAAGTLPLVVHAPATAARLGLDSLAARDLLELFAFVHPATFCLPTVRGLAAAVDVTVGKTIEDELVALPRIAAALLDTLDDMAALASPDMKDTALAMARGQWPWGAEVIAALDVSPAKKPRLGAGLDVWKSLPAWEEPPPGWRKWSPPVPTWRKRARPRATTPRPRPKPSRRACRRTSRMSCCWKPVPASARHSVTWHPPRCGRRRTARRSGSPPTPATCSARSTTNSTACTATAPRSGAR
jgi:hypothetical protein